jgi:hypothetical protein
MKKFLTISALLGSLIVFAPSQEAKAANSELTVNANAAEPQIRVRIGQNRRNRWNRRARVVTRTRIIRRGFRTYREVVQYRYRPNGSVTVRVLSRSRVG